MKLTKEQALFVVGTVGFVFFVLFVNYCTGV